MPQNLGLISHFFMNARGNDLAFMGGSLFGKNLRCFFEFTYWLRKGPDLQSWTCGHTRRTCHPPANRMQGAGPKERSDVAPGPATGPSHRPAPPRMARTWRRPAPISERQKQITVICITISDVRCCPQRFGTVCRDRTGLALGAQPHPVPTQGSTTAQ